MIQELKEVFGLHISDRVTTIKRFIETIDLNRPQILIRTDVKSFFENIGYERLSSILQQSVQISERSRKIYTAIFNGFYNQRTKEDSDTRKGLPRGLAVSSYLAELYLQEIDDKVRSMPEVKLYARYVDDIVMLLEESVDNDKAYEVFESVSGLFSDYGLQLHPLGDGKSSIHIYEPLTLHAEGIEYLGYSIILDPEQHELKIGLTDKKIEKKTAMIDSAFSRFERISRKDVKKAWKDLRDCLNYLSANYALRNSKEGLRCGIYYSNELITDLSKLDFLTEYLQRKEIRPYERSFSCPQDLDKYVRGIKEKISAIDFRQNWTAKKMVSFTPERIGYLKVMMRQE